MTEGPDPSELARSFRIYSVLGNPTEDDLRALRQFLYSDRVADELALHAMLDRHPALLGVLGFIGFSSEHPLYKRDQGNELSLDRRTADRADFVAAKESVIQPPAGRAGYRSAHLVELKSAGTRIADRHVGSRFSPEAAGAIGQLRDYKQWLMTVPLNRDALSLIGWDVRIPTLHLVMGASGEFERNPGQLDELKGHAQELGVSLYTVDEVLAIGDRLRQEARMRADVLKWVPAPMAPVPPQTPRLIVDSWPRTASWLADETFERESWASRVLKSVFINPVARYMPPGFLRGLLGWTRSEVAKSNWTDPGGWRSTVISYDGNPERMIDRILVKGGTIPMALRNRKKLAARLIARLIDQVDHQPAHVLCLGAGPGHIIMEALARAQHQAVATLVDISNDAFNYGRQLGERRGVRDRVRFIQGDVRDVKEMLEYRVDIVKMIGICEYLEDDQIVSIVKEVSGVMPPSGSIVFNSLSDRHGNDAFLRRVFGLHMIYRSVEQLQSLMAQAGFCDFVSYAEPLMVYEVVVGMRGPGVGSSSP